MRAGVDEGVGVEVAGGTRRSMVRAEVSAMELIDPGDRFHQLFSHGAIALGLGKRSGVGRCRMCGWNHAEGVCKTCSIGLGTAKQKVFWIAIPKYTAGSATAGICTMSWLERLVHGR